MMIKYRVHEVAKDLEVPSKEVIELLGKYYEEPHKHMTALTEEELSLVFEHYTKERAVENFDAYFATREQAIQEAAAKKEAAKEAAAKEAAAREAAAREAAAKEASANQAARETAARTQTAPRPQGPGAQQHAPQGQGQGRNQGQRPQQGGHFQRPGNAPGQQGGRPQGGQRPFGQQRPAQQQGNAQRPAAAAPAQPKGPQQKAHAADRGVRYVDTRGAQVELDKYNEHYEQIVPENARKSYNMQHKQKLKQRSADRRPSYAKRESEAEKLKRLQFEKAKKAQLKVSIPDEIAVGELAARLKVTASEVIKRLMKLGVMASISQTVDFDTASLIAIELGAKVEKEVVVTIEDQLIDDSEDKPEDLKPRSPVVVVMGHVDHGKTSLLDAIRHTNVVAGEAGGITQHIGAYRVHVGDKEITFLDTPGHAAFTAMRARGAMVTDIAVIVVAADDGIMPQTVEAINHAKAAKVSIIVAINKIDKPGANPDRVKQELTEHGLVPEEWGGETICVPVSAVKHENIDKLLEMIELVAEVKELKANPNRAGTGAVIEARLDKGRGPVATLLVQNGTLNAGDVIIAGTAVGHIRVMTDERGQRIEHAGPSVPVEVAGLAEVPQAGDIFHAVKDEKMARQLVEQRRTQEKEEQFKSYTKVTLDNLFSQMQEGEVKELNLIIKADVQGSVEAVTQSLEKLSSDEVRVKVIHGGVGPVNESDVYLAESSNAIIIGFNVRPDTDAQSRADLSGVEMRMYRVIYDCIADVQSAMKGMLAPKQREVQLGRVEVRQVYKISSVGTIAGCYVLDGKVTRSAQIRVVRDGIVITDDKIASLKRFKDDVKEVVQGYECGIGLEKYNDIKEGDIFEPYIIEEYRD
jgi:translation initiation factor IF-2